MMKLVRMDRANFTREEHELIAAHFRAIQKHAGAILDLIKHHVHVKWMDDLIRSTLNGVWQSRLKSALDDNCFANCDPPSPYYGYRGTVNACDFERHIDQNG